MSQPSYCCSTNSMLCCVLLLFELHLQLRGSLPRGAVSLQQQPQDHQQQQQQDPQQEQGPRHEQQQQQRAPFLQSLTDINMSFSGALRQTKTLAELLYLLRNRKWGRGFSDLDGVSVVGALVWLVRSDEWQQLQQEGSVGQEQWQAQRTVLKIIEVREVGCHEQGVMPR